MIPDPEVEEKFSVQTGRKVRRQIDLAIARGHFGEGHLPRERYIRALHKIRLYLLANGQRMSVISLRRKILGTQDMSLDQLHLILRYLGKDVSLEVSDCG